MNKAFRVFAIALAMVVSLSTFAQEKKEESKVGYEFKEIKRLPATSVKDQHRSGTCWSFSGLSFIESEALRLGKAPVDLSEMFVVRHTYSDRSTKYVRLHGDLNFGGGGACHDVTNMIRKYGIVPEEVYSGLDYGTESHVHGEMDAVLKGYMDQVIKNRNRKLSTGWHDGFNGILDGYLGELPETFSYEGKEYTPHTFAKEVVGINPDDYVEISSYSHHPYYSQFIFEVPDNWAWGSVYNVPLNEFMDIMYNAIDEGYTICWAADVSEKGFSWKNGIAIVPETNIEELAGSEKLKWAEMSDSERNDQMYSFEEVVPEMEITPELRQEAFDNYQNTDDHGMHITGLAKDQEGNKYFIVKNSWNTDNPYEGYLYASEAYVKYKTNYFMVHKDAIPEELKKKLGIH